MVTTHIKLIFFNTLW